jgi:hypothetical protein
LQSKVLLTLVEIFIKIMKHTATKMLLAFLVIFGFLQKTLTSDKPKSKVRFKMGRNRTSVEKPPYG